MKSVALFALAVFASSALAQTTATVPVTLDHNRIVIDVRFPMPDGTTTRVRAWVNNGATEMTMTDHLAKKLGLPITGATTTPPAEIHVGAMVIHPTEVKQVRVVTTESVAPGLSPEITIPAPVLRDYDLLVDYPNREFTIASPGSTPFKGTAVKAAINSESGQIQVPMEIDGEKTSLTLDLGSSFTMLPSDLVSKLQKTHSQWPHMTGAVGTADQWGTEDEVTATLLRMQLLQIGGVSEKNIAVSSSKAGGALGGNALLAYRIGTDYAHSTVYFDRTVTAQAPDMDVVGLTLRPEDDERFTVVGVAEFQGKPAVPDVKAGDLLVKIDGIEAPGGTMGQVWSLLGGAPGDVRELILSRDGKQFTVKATVHRFLDAARRSSPPVKRSSKK